MWHLAGDPKIPGEKRVIFISNAARSCAVWSQRSAPEPGAPVLWDYHVVLLAGGAIWDLDTTAGFPLPLDRYLDAAFPAHGQLDARLEPRFRVIGAELFRERFASDRSHMKKDGLWQAMPPPWPAIVAKNGETMNLFSFVDTEAEYLGEVFDLEGLRKLS